MSNGTTTALGYTVEVRTSYREPSLVCGVIVDAAWRTLPHETRKDGFGVPVGYLDKKLREQIAFEVAQMNQTDLRGVLRMIAVWKGRGNE